MRLAVEGVDIDHSERTSRHAISAAVADVLLDDHGIEFGLEQRASRAGFETGSVVAVLAHVAHHQPAALEWRIAAVADTPGPRALDEIHMTPGVGRQRAGVVIALPRQRDVIGREVVPFLASDLAGLAADADRCVGKEAVASSRFDYDSGGKLGFVGDDAIEGRLRMLEQARMDVQCVTSSGLSTVGMRSTDLAINPIR